MASPNEQIQEATSTTIPEHLVCDGECDLEAQALQSARDAVAKEEALLEAAPKMGILHHIKRGLSSFKKMSAKQIAGMVACVLMSVVGMSGQLITLNMWVGSFPSELNINVPFTILTLSSSTNALCYCLAFFGWAAIKRINIRFILTKHSNLYGFGVGWAIALNGVFIVSATAGTPEVIQAFLLSTAILWTFLFVKMIFGEKRSYNSPLIYVSFILSLAGILVGSASKFSGGQAMSAVTLAWTGLFAFGMVPGAVTNVMSTKYMRHFTLAPEELARHEAHKNGRLASPMMSSQEDDLPELDGTDANTAKMAMLAVGNIWQAITVFAMLPVGAIPWFGSSPNVSSLGTTLVEGWKCTMGAAPGCGGSLMYFALFNLAFILSNVGNAFLNYYSPAMTSMISQLSSPLTALALIIIPAWNVTGTAINIPESLTAVVLITVGSLCYTAWEESTRHADIIRAQSRRSQSRLSQHSRRSLHAAEEGSATSYGATL